MTAIETVLVAGFEPFDRDTVNPSSLAAHALDGRVIAQRRLVGIELPCAFDSAWPALREAIRRTDPALVIAVGQAAGSAAVRVECVAVNRDDARIPDNAGATPVDRVIALHGPPSYAPTLPVERVLDALSVAGIAAEASQSAGTFVCNHVFYQLMRALERTPAVRGGFIHVPALPEQAVKAAKPMASMALETTVRALEVVIAAVVG